MISEKFISTGSGSPIAYGYLEAEFKAYLGVNEGYKLVIHSIEAAIRRNVGTGSGINVLFIDRNGYGDLYDEAKAAVGAVFRTFVLSRGLSIAHL